MNEAINAMMEAEAQKAVLIQKVNEINRLYAKSQKTNELNIVFAEVNKMTNQIKDNDNIMSAKEYADTIIAKYADKNSK